MATVPPDWGSAAAGDNALPEGVVPVPFQPEAPDIRVAMLDDHHVVMEGLSLIIDNTPGLISVGQAASSEEIFEVVERDHPDVVILDVTLGAADGITVMRDLLARHRDLRVIVLTMHGDAETVRQSLLAGAHGYVVKGARADDLVDAIVAVMHGDQYLHSAVTSAIIGDAMQWQRHGSPLSPREREILTLLASGESPGQIGRLMGISVLTVRRHLANLATKLDVHGVEALRRYAEAHGLGRV